MANDNSANVSQFPITKDLKLAENVDLAPNKVVGVNGESTYLNAQQLTTEVVVPASGQSATVYLPPLAVWKGKDALIYNRAEATTGTIVVKLVENATTLGTFTAAGDKLLIRNVNGDHVVVLIDVTT